MAGGLIKLFFRISYTMCCGQQTIYLWGSAWGLTDSGVVEGNHRRGCMMVGSSMLVLIALELKKERSLCPISK